MPTLWDQLPPATLGTCEPDMAGWVVHPAETLSAFAYVVVGLIVWSSVAPSDRGHLPGVAVIIITIGLTSILFHSSFAAVFQALDLATIYLLLGHLVATTLVGGGYLKPRHFMPALVLLGIGGATLPFLHLGLGFAGLTLQTLGILWVGYRHASATTDYRTAAWLLISGAALLALDHAQIGCVTGRLEHVIQPHVGWHVLSATSVFFFCRVALHIKQRGARATTHSSQPR